MLFDVFPIQLQSDNDDLPSSVEEVVKIIKYVENIISHCLCIYDYETNRILYISENLNYFYRVFIDYERSNAYYECVDSDERLFLKKIHKAYRRQFKTISSAGENQFIFSYDTVVRAERSALIFKITQFPLVITKNGLPRIILLSIIPSPVKEREEPVMYRYNDKLYYRYTLLNDRWEKMNVPFLTDNEFKVILFSAQGYSEVEIAEKMYKSHDSIRSYKRAIYKKVGVNSINAAIPFLICNKWLLMKEV